MADRSPTTTDAADAADSPDVTEQKRQRQREHAKRSYYKRVKAMDALKAERELLEKQYREALAAQQQPQPQSQSPPQLEPERAGDVTAAGVMSLSATRDELREENKQLKTAIARFFTLQRRLQQSIEDMDSDSDASDPMLALSLTDEDDVLVSHVLALQFGRVMLTKPLTSEECAEMNRTTHDEMVAFLKGNGGSYGTAGAALCGWQEYRTTRNGRFRFSTRKTFRRSAEDLANKTWDIVSSPVDFQELYSSNINMQLDLVQRVDDDNVLFYRTVQIPNSAKVGKALLLASRFHSPSGHVVLLRSLDKSRVAPMVEEGDLGINETAVIWSEVFIWVVFTEEGARQEHCMMEFGGFVMNATPGMAEFWMLEALLISLRWENQVIGPVFQLS